MTRQQQTLETRVAAALGSSKVCADDLEVLIPDIEAGIAKADAVAAQERDVSLDPSTSPSDAEQAHQRAVVAELQRERCKVALPRLRAKLSEALRAEHEDRWNADANKVASKVDAAQQHLGRYSELAELIAVALAGCEYANREVERVNGSAPDGTHRRIDKIDLSPFKTLVLPDPARPGHALWPPPQPSLAAQYAATMAAPVHPGADWAAAQEARAEAARAEQQRHADNLAYLTRLQEERVNREEREAFLQQQSGRR